MDAGGEHVGNESRRPTAGPRRARRRVDTSASSRAVLASVAWVTTACVLPSFLLGAMAVQMRRDLRFDELGVGTAFSTFFAAASLASAPSGRLAERIGPGRSLRIAAACTAVTCLTIAGLSRSLPTLLVPMVFAGVANALGQPAGNLLIARSLPRRRQGLSFAIKQSAIPAATLLAGLAVPTFALTLGWRWAYVGAAVFACTAAFLVPERAAGAEASPPPTRAGRDGPVVDAPGEDVPLRIMVRLTVGISLGASAATMLGSFLVIAAVESGMSERRASLILVVGSVLGIVVRLTAGVLADRRDGRHLVVVAQMLGVGALTFLALATGSPVAYAVAGPLAFCTAWAWPGLFILAVVRSNPVRPGAATGIAQTGTSLGAVTGPILFGAVASTWSTQVAWLGSGLLLIGACASILSVRRALIGWRTGVAG